MIFHEYNLLKLGHPSHLSPERPCPIVSPLIGPNLESRKIPYFGTQIKGPDVFGPKLGSWTQMGVFLGLGLTAFWFRS